MNELLSNAEKFGEDFPLPPDNPRPAPLIPEGFQGRRPEPRVVGCIRDERDMAAEQVVPAGMTDMEAEYITPANRLDGPGTLRNYKRWLEQEIEKWSDIPDTATINGKAVPVSAPDLMSQSVTSKNPKDIAAATKRPLQLIPPIAEEQIAWALKFGADRYGPWNWRDEKISLSNYLGALKRHLNDLMSREDVASDSGCHHMAHIGATACIILDALAHGCVIDDRPK